MKGAGRKQIGALRRISGGRELDFLPKCASRDTVMIVITFTFFFFFLTATQGFSE